MFPIGLTKVAKQLPQSFNNVVPTVLVITGLYIVVNLLLTFIANYAQKRFVGEKEMLDVSMVGELEPNQSTGV